jgi:aspartate aminotransferase
LGLTTAFRQDAHKLKVGLGVGAYRDDDGMPFVLASVREAELVILNQRSDHEYADISGNPLFLQHALGFVYGKDSEILTSKRVAAVQTLSGTGACRIAAEFLSRFTGTEIYLPDPTWGNHVSIMKAGGLNVKTYRYYNKLTQSFDFEGLMDDVANAPTQSIFLFHSCAHNPTGFDPSHEQWNELSDLTKKLGHVVFFDNAYQGFASGNAERDAYSIRRFVSDGHKILVAQSFAKVRTAQTQLYTYYYIVNKMTLVRILDCMATVLEHSQ